MNNHEISSNDQVNNDEKERQNSQFGGQVASSSEVVNDEANTSVSQGEESKAANTDAHSGDENVNEKGSNDESSAENGTDKDRSKQQGASSENSNNVNSQVSDDKQGSKEQESQEEDSDDNGSDESNEGSEGEGSSSEGPDEGTTGEESTAEEFDLEKFTGTKGTQGNDYLFDRNSNEIIGLEGDDRIYGSRKDNTYYYRSGDGNDTIIDSGGNDKIVLTDLNLEDISFERSGNWGVMVRITDTEETINLRYQEYSTNYSIESIEFADGSNITADEISRLLPPLERNSAPKIRGVDLGAIEEDTSLIITNEQLIANSFDIDGDKLTVTWAYLSYPSNRNAELTKLDDGTWQLTPNENFNGEDLSITYIVSDGQYSRSAKATFSVSSVNDAADANDDAVSMVATQTRTINTAELLANDTDVEGDALRVSAVSNAKNIQVTLNDDGTISIEADDEYRGEASFDYTVTDAKGATSTATVKVNVKQLGDFDLDEFEGIIGSERADSLRANRNGGSIIGLEGDDYIYGSRNDDNYYYRRGDGNDTIYDYRGADKITLVDLNEDDISISRSGRWDLVVTVNDTDEQITLKYQNYYKSITEIEFANGKTLDLKEAIKELPINGTEQRDYLVGTVEDDVINGFAGNDTLNGNSGDDTLNGGAGNDSLYGWTGNDILNGGEGNDYLIGAAGNDTLNGGAGNDRLYAGSGEDSLNGGAGDDYIIAGNGKDTLIFEDLFGNDTVWSFEEGESGEDVISFQDIDGLESFEDVVAVARQEGLDTIINVSDDASITLKRVGLENLNEADFIFG